MYFYPLKYRPVSPMYHLKQKSDAINSNAKKPHIHSTVQRVYTFYKVWPTKYKNRVTKQKAPSAIKKQMYILLISKEIESKGVKGHLSVIPPLLIILLTFKKCWN